MPFFMIRDDPSRSELTRPGLAVRVDPVRVLYLPCHMCPGLNLLIKIIVQNVRLLNIYIYSVYKAKS